MSSEVSRPLPRLLALVAAGLLAIVVPAVAGAQPQTPSASPSTTTTVSTTSAPINPETGSTYPTTSTNVLVTSPPPTVAPSTTVAAAVVGRSWPVDVPAGCAEPALPDVVFVGTVQEMDARTARYRIDQLRAGTVDQLSYQGLIDIRYGIDTKYLEPGRQYLVGAAVDAEAGALVSRVTGAAPLFGGDEVIGQSETDATCPTLDDPVRTLLTNGLPIDSGLLRPLEEEQGKVLRSIVVPVVVAIAIVFGLAALRWVLYGMGWGISETLRTSREPQALRRARRLQRDAHEHPSAVGHPGPSGDR